MLAAKSIVMASAGFYHSVVLVEEESESNQSTYIQDFQKLIGNSMRSDISFLFEDNISKVIYAHRAILYARCPVLDKEIDQICDKPTQQFKELHKILDNDLHVVVRIASYSIQSFLRFLEYVYTDQAMFLKDNQKEESSNSVFMETLKLSEKYEMPELHKIYCEEIKSRICLQSACEIYNLSYKYNVPDIKDSVSKYILDNSAEIIKTEGFLDLPKELMTQIMQCISIKLSSLEETLKKAN